MATSVGPAFAGGSGAALTEIANRTAKKAQVEITIRILSASSVLGTVAEGPMTVCFANLVNHKILASGKICHEFTEGFAGRVNAKSPMTPLRPVARLTLRPLACSRVAAALARSSGGGGVVVGAIGRED